jgi:hypothetical protein
LLEAWQKYQYVEVLQNNHWKAWKASTSHAGKSEKISLVLNKVSLEVWQKFHWKFSNSFPGSSEKVSLTASQNLSEEYCKKQKKDNTESSANILVKAKVYANFTFSLSKVQTH